MQRDGTSFMRRLMGALIVLGLALPAPAQQDEPTREELIELVKQRRRELSEATAAVYAELRGLIPAVDPLSAEQILEGLGEGEVVVSFVWTEDAVFALSAGGGDVHSHTMAESDETEDALRASLTELRGALASETGEPITDGLLDELRSLLLPEDLMARIGDASRVIVVPDGPLHSVPLEVLLPDTPICYSPSATIYLDRVRVAQERESGSPPTVLVLGDPVFGDAPIEQEQVLASVRGGEFDAVAAGASALEQVRLYGGTLEPLPGTKAESREIADAFRKAKIMPSVLTGDRATAERLRRAVERKPTYLHLATHGLPGNAARPYEASLALTQPETPTVDDIGFLTLEELMGSWLGKLDGCQLVTLSACDTGRGVAQGDTVMSLPIGFFAAGAETVVASLWRVDDAATALLMARFYENLLGQTDASRSVFGREYEAGQPLPKLDALGEARAWLRGLDAQQAERARRGLDRSLSRAPGARRVEEPVDAQHPYAHPRYWAPFVLVGHAE